MIQRSYHWLGVPFLMHLLQKAENEMMAMQMYEVPKMLMLFIGRALEVM